MNDLTNLWNQGKIVILIFRMLQHLLQVNQLFLLLSSQYPGTTSILQHPTTPDQSQFVLLLPKTDPK